MIKIKNSNVGKQISSTFATGSKNNNNTFHKRTNSFQSNKGINTLKISKDISSSPSTPNPKKEFTLTETLQIISEIQNQFDNSVKENRKPLEEIKRLIDNNLSIDNYIALSDLQKENISTDIERSSDLRIQNYQTAFNYIRTSLDGIKDCLEKIITNEDDSEGFDSSLDIIENDNDDIGDQNEKKIYHTYRGKKIKKGNENVEEDTDFSEGVMLENAFVLPPKNSPFNYQNVKDMTRTRSKKFSVLSHDKKTEPKRKSLDDTQGKEKKRKIILESIQNANIIDEEASPKESIKNKDEEKCLVF